MDLYRVQLEADRRVESLEVMADSPGEAEDRARAWFRERIRVRSWPAKKVELVK